jgi:hypothetical protein
MYDRFLGGRANFRTGCDAAAEILRFAPEVRDAV